VHIRTQIHQYSYKEHVVLCLVSTPLSVQSPLHLINVAVQISSKHIRRIPLNAPHLLKRRRCLFSRKARVVPLDEVERVLFHAVRECWGAAYIDLRAVFVCRLQLFFA